jgi:hypothetical protein
MATEVVPIQVVIGLRPNGHADHPNWSLMPTFGNDPEPQIIVKWKYDKSSGHQEASAGSPIGQQLGMLLVTDAFAQEAVTTFPGIVSILTEAQAEIFWNNKAHLHVPQNHFDVNLLIGLDAELNLREKLGQDTTQLKARIANALDVLHSEPGIKRNRMKRFADAKILLDITIKP